MANTYTLEALKNRLKNQITFIYRDIWLPATPEEIASELIQIMGLENIIGAPTQHKNNWSEEDIILITYADSVLDNAGCTDKNNKEQAEGLPTKKKPLKALKYFLDTYTEQTINSLHILPFFPYSSDDGFSVIDFSSVNESHGDWLDVQDIARDYRLMADLVINHCSARSKWFDNFVNGVDPGRDYFFTASPNDDLSEVVRPRTNDLLRKVPTADGDKYVWCTFSHDQVDLDFRNIDVLKQFVSIIRLYLDMGVRIFRLDAIAFLWKKIGSNCLNLPETHEVVRLLRTLIEHAQHDAVIITETNIPNRENLEYFGNTNEAHCVYNFSLPPLLVNALITGKSYYLRQWQMSMPPAQNGTAYFNFIASHDGIGLRPVEGLLHQDEVDRLVATMKGFGGEVSWRALENGENKPYEINIALFDALKGTIEGEDQFGIERFICAHAIMFALEGIPGLYIHSLLATSNDYARMEHTSSKRAINRHQWDLAKLEEALQDSNTQHAKIYTQIQKLLSIRTVQDAFHPNAVQFTLQLGEEVFGFWRQSMSRRQSIFCINNISNQPVSLPLTSINLTDTDSWSDLISGKHYNDEQMLELAPYQTVWISN